MSVFTERNFIGLLPNGFVFSAERADLWMVLWASYPLVESLRSSALVVMFVYAVK